VRTFFGVPCRGAAGRRAALARASRGAVDRRARVGVLSRVHAEHRRRAQARTRRVHGAWRHQRDCLSLNVWTAAASASERRPVYAWLHGGGLVEGSGSIATFDGESLARKGLVVATVNYRLGVFGYFAHPELTRESPHHASGNYGYLDQVAALQWV
jgi:carboxylesterase type B